MSYIASHPYRILIIGCSGSGQTNVLSNLMKHRLLDIDKIYLDVKDPIESKHHSLVIHKQFMMFMEIWKTKVQQRIGEC